MGATFGKCQHCALSKHFLPLTASSNTITTNSIGRIFQRFERPHTWGTVHWWSIMDLLISRFTMMGSHKWEMRTRLTCFKCIANIRASDLFKHLQFVRNILILLFKLFVPNASWNWITEKHTKDIHVWSDNQPEAQHIPLGIYPQGQIEYLHYLHHVIHTGADYEDESFGSECHSCFGTSRVALIKYLESQVLNIHFCVKKCNHQWCLILPTPADEFCSPFKFW